TFIAPAFATNSQNPVILCTAGLIMAKAGNKEKAKVLLIAGLKNNPIMQEEVEKEARQELNRL
ncbi:MAG: hypothetical protein H7258_03700, partial [Ferruginibacter sp.]|nr:hypothetical protein [Ferruginibacter sp.]